MSALREAALAYIRALDREAYCRAVVKAMAGSATGQLVRETPTREDAMDAIRERIQAERALRAAVDGSEG